MKQEFNATRREALIKTLSNTPYDLVVIGGGITGSGIALDAAARGLRTALVEMGDFASGTSSSSTKLIHGGLRYLKQFEIGLVRETGRERAIVHKLAPHLVRPEKMLLPLIKNGTYGKILTSMGLMVYDILAGVEKPDQRKMLSKEETMQLEPMLKEDIVEGGGLYAEYRTDDARLTIEVLKTAAGYGADSINYVKATDFIYNEAGKVCGLHCHDELAGQHFEVKANSVVSAAGPWVDELRDKNNSLSGKHLHLTKGVHIVLHRERFPVKHAVYFDVPDGRMLFAIPRGQITYVGTTDTDYHGDKNHVTTDRVDVEYLLAGVNHSFPHVGLTIQDVISSWAGLRPLIHEEGKSASEISRKDETFESETGLISIAGGKLTGYRKMAKRIVDLVVERQGARAATLQNCKTDQIVLSGGPFEGIKAVDTYITQMELACAERGLDAYRAYYLVSNYGRETEAILQRMEDFEPGEPEVALARAELWYAVHAEMVQQALDFIERRSGRLYFDITSLPAIIEAIITDMQQYLGWSVERAAAERRQIQAAIELVSHFN